MRPDQAVDEGSRLADAIGWAMVLPQMLARGGGADGFGAGGGFDYGSMRE